MKCNLHDQRSKIQTLTDTLDTSSDNEHGQMNCTRLESGAEPEYRRADSDALGSTETIGNSPREY